MSVDQYALTSLDLVKAYMGFSENDGQVPAISVYHDESASATAATVEVTDSTLELVITGGTNAGTDSIDLTAAASDTMAELVSVINALAKGWVAKQLGAGAADSDDLVIQPAASAFGSANVQELLAFNNYLLETLINAASDWIENWCRRKFKSRSHEEYHDGEGGEYVGLDNYPVTQVSRVSLGVERAMDVRCTAADAEGATVSVDGTNLTLTQHGGTNDGDTELLLATYATLTALVAAIAGETGWTASLDAAADGDTESKALVQVRGRNAWDAELALYAADERLDDFKVYPEEGLLSRRPGFTAGRRNVRVDYTAGYATIPDDLAMIATQIVADAYNRAGVNTGLESEKIGDYAYKRASAGAAKGAVYAVAPQLAAALQAYRRIVVA